MFGMANQLLAVIALAIVTAVLVNAGRVRYAAVTLVPMAFVLATTSTTGYLEITGRFYEMTKAPATALRGWLNIGLTAMLLVCAAVILASVARRWYVVLSGRKAASVAEV
jgi:carbon starvation protein